MPPATAPAWAQQPLPSVGATGGGRAAGAQRHARTARSPGLRCALPAPAPARPARPPPPKCPPRCAQVRGRGARPAQSERQRGNVQPCRLPAQGDADAVAVAVAPEDLAAAVAAHAELRRADGPAAQQPRSGPRGVRVAGPGAERPRGRDQGHGPPARHTAAVRAAGQQHAEGADPVKPRQCAAPSPRPPRAAPPDARARAQTSGGRTG